MLTDYESNRIRNGVRKVGGYFNQAYALASYEFRRGYSLDKAISIAVKRYS